MNQDLTWDYGSHRGAFKAGMRDSFGVPALMLTASYIGFGSLVKSSGLSIWLGLASTLTGWALPGQLAMVELYGIGASMLAIGMAVLLINLRLLPMTVTLIPLFRDPKVPGWAYFPMAHLIAVTGWVAAMHRCPGMPQDQRIPYFLGFTLLLLVSSILGTAVGFFATGLVPEALSLGMIFLNPLYFMLMLVSDRRVRARVWAMILGAVLGPLLHLASPDWGLLITGLVAGSTGFYLDKWMEARHG